MFNNLSKITIFCLSLFLLGALVQWAAIAYFHYSPATAEHADLIVVFPGGSERKKAGTMLAKEGYAKQFMVINEKRAKLQKHADKNDIDKDVVLLHGGKSRSTFEDVFTTAKTLKQNNLTSVTLVTSAYHLPRSLYLLKTYLLLCNQNVKVYCYPVETKRQSALKTMQILCNEVVKSWGSSFEMISSRIIGSLPLDVPSYFTAREFIKKHFLFKV